uniref:Calponin-homology (CH) domain-containing protein n=1 Tax=Parastrongyloides trichosuri TaxID=131310 RepID=A0A0N5A4Z7_PARTI
MEKVDDIQDEQCTNIGISNNNICSLHGDADGIGIEKLDFKIGEISADLMDEKRRNRRAYDYLCRLSEVRTWIGELLNEENIPCPIDLETNLANGVLLARIGNKIAPSEVQLMKIYDFDQTKYNNDGLHYRHTDNIMLWRHSMTYIKFPEIIIPETVDVYRGNNGGIIYCLYTLAVYLFRLRKGPPIKNQSGNVEFRECDIEKMKERLKDINLPSFHDVDDILSNRFVTDRKERAKVVLAINQLLVENNDEKSVKLYELLTNPDGDFMFVKEDFNSDYLESLLEEKKEDEIISHDKIQSILCEVNRRENLKNLKKLLFDDCRLDELKTILYELADEKVIESVMPLYKNLLIERMVQNNNELTLEDVLEIISIGNSCMKVKLSVTKGSVDDVYESLNDKVLSLIDILDSNMKNIYYITLNDRMNHYSQIMNLTEIKEIITQCNNLSENDLKVINMINLLKHNENSDVLEMLFDQLEIPNVLKENVPLYLLNIAKRSSTKILYFDDIVKLVDEINKKAHDAKIKSQEIWYINNALKNEEPYALIEALKNSHWYNDGIIREPILQWYPATFECKVQEKNINKNEDLKWIEYTTDIGNFYVNNTEFSLGPHEIVTENYITESDIEEIIDDTNYGFDDYYKINEYSLIKGQKVVRKYLENRKNERNLEEKSKAAKIIQEHFRDYRRKQNLDTLLNCADPPLSLVRKFIELLRDTELDYEEELTIERTKSRVTILINNNRNMDIDLDELDHKIGLLVRHRISLEEVMAHKNKVIKKMSSYLNTQGSIKRREKMKLNALQQFLFHIQTEPKYLSNLYQECPDDNLYEKALLPLFNFVSEKREEYLFVVLCREILKRYIECIQEPKKFLHNNDPAGNKLLKLIKRFFQTLPSYDLLGISLKEIHSLYYDDDHSIRINLNPISMFEEKYNKPPKDIYEALTDEDIVKILDDSKNFIIKWSKRFVSELTKNIRLPKSVRYLMKVVQVEIRNSIPSLCSSKVSAIVSYFLWKCYFEPSIIEGKIFIRESGLTFNEEQYDRLNMISKLIGYAAFGKSYGNQEPHLFSLNDTIMEIHKMFLDIVNKSLENQTLDQIYNMNQYSSYISTQKLTLDISVDNLIYLIDLLKKYSNFVFDGPSDKLAKLFEKIELKSDDDKIEDRLTLLLSPMHPEQVPSLIDYKELFVQTKKYFVDLLLCGVYGDTVPEVLSTEINEKHEEAYRELISADDDQFPSLAAKQQKVTENLITLSKVNVVSLDNNYQTLVNQIADEIRRQGEYRQTRSGQITHYQETIKRLEDKRKDYEDRLEKYKLFLDSCLENMKRNSLKPKIKSDSQKASKLLNDREKLLNPKNIKVNAEKMLKKEILSSSILTTKELSKFNFEINFTGKMDQFEIVVKKPKTDPITKTINFQDLLEHEFNGDASIQITDEISFNVGPFIGYLNKKFYAK